MMGLEYHIFERLERERARQAEEIRLLRMVRVDRPSKIATVMAWTGRRLVRLGEGLQSRAVAPAVTCIDTGY